MVDVGNDGKVTDMVLLFCHKKTSGFLLFLSLRGQCPFRPGLRAPDSLFCFLWVVAVGFWFLLLRGW